METQVRLCAGRPSYWLLLTNGSKQEAYRLRDEFQTFLADVTFQMKWR